MNDLIEIELIPKKKLFYNDASAFGVYGCETKEESKVKLSAYYNFTIKGKMPKLELGAPYKAELEEVKDPKYGIGYYVHTIFQLIPETTELQKDYLKAILTELQVEEIYKVYPNEDVIQLIAEDKFDYTKVKGIGAVTYQRIKQKITENLEYKELFSKLGKYGITYDTIKKLADEFGSNQIAIQKIQENPYELTRIRGIGFKKADAIARNMGMPLDSPFRIKCGIKTVIGEEQNSGHTFVHKKELLSKAHDLLLIDHEFIEAELDDSFDDIIVKDDRISLTKTYNAELYISEKLKEMLDESVDLQFDVEKFIEEAEVKFNLKLTEQQRGFFDNIKKHNVNLLIGFAGCVDAETEFFTGDRWKKISEYKEGDKVLQYNEDGTANLVDPLKYHKIPETKMTLIKNKSGSINQCLSDEHTVVYKTSKGHLAALPFSEVLFRHKNNRSGFVGKFITTFDYKEGKGIKLTDEQIKIMVAVIADGNFRNKTNNVCRVNIKKARKKERLEILLKEANIEYKSIQRKDGYTNYYFIAPIRTKKFDKYWYNCSYRQLKIIANEVLKWDGRIHSSGRKSFSTKDKESADFIQFVFTVCGHRTTIYIDNRIGQKYKNNNYIRKSISYEVTISQRNTLVSLIARTPDKKTEFIEIEPPDGFKYCFSLPSGMWVMRREGRICVTGNCGKSMMQRLVIYLLEQLGYTYKLMAPTGKAAKVLSKYTDRKASTIHKAIGIGQNKDEQSLIEITEDFIIVDESSMIDVYLTSLLLKKISNPRTRILFVGDSFQLPSVAAGNILHDLISSKMIPMTKLDIVFRQEDGGILDIATKMRKGERFIADDFVGAKKFGNDLTIHSVDSKWMKDGYIHYYKKYLKNYKPEDILILSPRKTGELGTVLINQVAQSLVNPSSGELKELKYNENVTYRQNDYVINTKNVYDIANIQGEKSDIVNGDTGTVIDIIVGKEKDKSKDFPEDPNGIVVKFDHDTIKIPLEDISQLLHSWCITKHKSQGSSAKIVIIILDKSHKFQASANLLYTALTRATEEAVILCQAETINFAMRKVDNLKRFTWLQEMLKGEQYE